MRLIKLILIFTLGISSIESTSNSYISHGKALDDETTCFNDGYAQSDSSCTCANSLITGQMCDSFECLNYGLVKNNNDIGSCNCFNGVWGTHCEPVTCADAYGKSIGVSETRLTFLLTNNKVVRQLISDNVDDVLTSLTNLANNTELGFNAAYGYITSFTTTAFAKTIDYTTPATKFDNIFGNLIKNIRKNPLLDPTADKRLYLSDILNMVQNSNYDDNVHIITNLGITNLPTDFSQQIQDILQVALAKKTRINIFVLGQSDTTKSIFYLPSYAPLLQIARATGGLIINPYPQISYKSPPGKSISDCLTQLVPILNNGRSVYKYSGTITGSKMIHKLYLDADDAQNCTGYLSISSTTPITLVLDHNVFQTASTYENVTILTNIQVIKFVVTKCIASSQIFILLPTPSDPTQTFDLQIFSSSKKLSGEVGFASDETAETSSILPLMNVQNNVVARIPIDQADILLIKSTFNDNIGHFVQNQTDRPFCYKNRKLGYLHSSTNSLGSLSLINKNSGYQEWIPFIFATNNNLSVQATTAIVIKTTLKQALIDYYGDYYYLFVDREISDVDTSTTPMPSTIQTATIVNTPAATTIVLDTTTTAATTTAATATSTFTPSATPSPFPISKSRSPSIGFAIARSATIFNDLFLQPDSSSLLVQILKYLKSSNFYTTFVSNVFYGKTSGNLLTTVISTDLSNLTTHIMNSMSTASGQTACTPTNYVQTSLIDILKKSDLQKYSDLYIITDQLYGFDSTTGVYSNETLFNLIDSKKPRINILLYTKSCPSNFVDSSKPEIQSYLLLTQKSGGAFVATGDPTEVVNWFKMGEQYETSSYDIIYQEDQNKEVSGALLSRSGFHLKQNTNYTIWGTLVHVDSNKFKPSFSLYSSTGTKLPQPITNTIGDQFSASFGVSVPSDDIYTIEFNTDRIPSMEYQIRVLQYNPTFGFDLSFISNTSVQTSPEYGDSLQINCLAQKFNQTNDAIMPETIEIFDSTYKLVFNDTFRAGTGIGQFLSNNKWQCVNVDQVYYIRIDTQDESRTFSVTCLQSGAGNPTGVCLHGGTELTDKTCLCPVGWSGVICGQIDCMNNATLVGSVCNCQTDYTGQFCEHALGKCSNDDLQYNTEVTTFTLVVDLQSSLLDDVQSIGRNPNNLPQLSEYILVTYDGSNNESSNAGIFKTSSLAIFAATITNLVKLTTASIPQTNYYDYLAKGLNLQTGSRSVLLWVPDLVDCTNEPASMSASIINLIQKKSADVRYLSRANNLECSTFANVVLSGNGMITDVTLDASDLSDYVFFNLLTQNPTYLIVMDSNYYSTSAECSNDVIIEFPVNNDETYYITLLGYEKGDMTLNPNGESATPITSNILSFTIDSKVINKLTLKGKSSINKCGYTIETSSLTRITYTYKSLAFSGEKEYAPLTNSPSTTVYFNIEGKSGLVSDLLQKFPLVSLVEASNSQNIPVQRQDNCNYKWSFTFKCDNKNAASHYTYKIKGVGGDYQKTISVDCLTMVDCNNNGVTSATGCICDAGWKGLDCSIPICKNGYTTNSQQCVCNDNYYGSQCTETI